MVDAVQRWRIAFRRGAPALDLGPADIARTWEAALVESGIPVVMSTAATPRPRLTFAAPLPPGRAAEHDLADVVIGERWPLPRLRPLLAAALPAGFELVDLYDVWPGAPSIAASLSAMSHRAVLAGLSPDELAAAVAGLLGAARLDRSRAKAESKVSYDLRPLIIDLRSGPAQPSAAGPAAGAAAGPVLRMALRTSSDGPSGRPDEVILAAGESLGRELELVDLIRERLWTSDEAPILG